MSFGEKKMLENVRALVVSEVSHACGMEHTAARALVEKTVNHK
ncbi:MAG: hypothetical protein ACREIN_03195 [Candidatus Methylomirabilaceae bacterium]